MICQFDTRAVPRTGKILAVSTHPQSWLQNPLGNDQGHRQARPEETVVLLTTVETTFLVEMLKCKEQSIQSTKIDCGHKGHMESECRTKQSATNAKPKVQSRDHQANVHASLGTEVLSSPQLLGHESP